jgi:hypothetical protein
MHRPVSKRTKTGKEARDMNFATFAATAVLVLILYLAIRYIYKEKKKGNACIGCPYADSCPKHRQNEAACCGNALHQKADTH